MEWISAILQSLALLIIAPQLPTGVSKDWKSEQSGWQQEGNVLTFSATSTSIVDQCHKHPEHFLVTPILVQGAHQFFLDGNLIERSGDPTFTRAYSIYNIATLHCEKIKAGSTLTWKVSTSTHSLATLNSYPALQESMPALILFCGPMMLLIAGALLAIAFFIPIIFWGKIDRRLIGFLVMGAICYAICYIFTVPDYFDTDLSPLVSQKISDSALWMALLFAFQILYRLGQSTQTLARCVTIFSILGTVIVLLSSNLDQLQVGSNLALATISLSILFSVFYLLAKNRGKIAVIRRQTIEFIVMLIFVGTAINDGGLFLAGLNSVPLFPLGSLTIVVLISMAVNQQINRTYDERDHLQKNLEKEVESKTSELKEALFSLKAAQADLVQSAKLASVGTLAAGIAHEINNALNYVNGSLFPLEGWIKKQNLPEQEKSKAMGLLSLMQEGLKLTFGIITSLKRQTSSNQIESEKLNVKEILDGVILILKAKLSGIEMGINLPDEIFVDAHRASLSQIFMNIVGNAADALEESKSAQPRIFVEALQKGEQVVISVQDNGPGMSQEVKERIFEPFFTTKPVGKGTGLGLYIVNAEVAKIGGTLKVETQPGEGCRFEVSLPAAVRSGSQEVA